MRRIPNVWNEASTKFNFWPTTKLTTISFKTPPKHLKWSELSPSFQQDADAYLALRANPDLFDERPEAPKRPLAATTLGQQREHLRLAASFLARDGEAVTSLADLVRPESFKKVLRYYHNQANREPNAFVITLAKTLIQVAQYHTGATSKEVQELKRLAGNLPALPFDLTPKNKALLRQLESDRLRAKLYFLPEQLMGEVAKDLEEGRVRFVEAQVAIAIDILLAKFWTRRRPQHLLTGKAVCGICGGPAAPIGKDYIACSTARRQGTCTNRASIRRAEIERWIVEALRHQLMAPEQVREFIRTFNDEVNRTRRDCGHRRDGLQREQKSLERRIDTLLEAFVSGALKGASVQTKLEALEGRQAEVAKELANLSEEPVRLHPNLAALYRQKVAALQDLMDSDATRTEAVEIIRSLVEQVIFRPTAEAGLEIELVGDIAGMVHLAQNSNENSPVSGAVHDQFARSVKVVAGVGFEPTTFRL